MPNAQRGEVAVTIGGVERRLRLSWNALADAQDLLGEPDLNALGRRLDSMDFRVLRAVLAAGLRAGGWRDAEPRQVMDQIDRKELPGVWAAVAKAAREAFAGDDEEQPEQPAAGANGGVPLAPSAATEAPPGPPGLN